MGNMKNDFTLNRADSALLARDFSLAARLYRSILAKDPSNKDVLLKLGSTYVKAGQDGKAEGAYVGVLRIEPMNFEALNSLGGVFRRLGKYKDSIKVLERALKIKNCSEVKYNMGFTYKLMEEYDSAADCFTAVIEDNPNDVLAYNHLGAIQARRGEHKKALQTYWKGLQIDPNHPVLHYNSAISFLAQGNYEEARNSYENALRAKPGWPDAMNGLAELFIQRGKYPNAQDLISQAIKINPENTNLQVTQGRLCVKRGNYSDAETIYRSVLEKRPDDYSVMGRLERVYEKTNKFDEAYGLLERMKGGQGTDNDVTKRNIQLLINQGKLKDAGNLLNQERAATPDDPEILNLLSQYFIRAGKTDKAHGCFKRLCEVKPGAVNFLQDAAMQFMRMGDYENAEDYLKKFLEKSPDNLEAMSCLGNVYEEQKRYDESIEVFKKVLEKDGSNPVIQEAVSRVGAHAETNKGVPADVNEVLSGVSGDESPEELQEKIRMYENSVGNIEKFAVSDDQKPDDNSVGQDIDSFEKIDFDELLKLEYKDSAESDIEEDYSELIMEDSPVDFESEEYDDRKESIKTSELMPQDMPFEFNSGSSDDSGFNPLDYNYTPKYSPSEKSEVLDVNGTPMEEDFFEEEEDLNPPKRNQYNSPYQSYPPQPQQPQMPPQPSQSPYFPAPQQYHPQQPQYQPQYQPRPEMKPENYGSQPYPSQNPMDSGFAEDPEMARPMPPEPQPEPDLQPEPQLEPQQDFQPEPMLEPQPEFPEEPETPVDLPAEPEPGDFDNPMAEAASPEMAPSFDGPFEEEQPSDDMPLPAADSALPEDSLDMPFDEEPDETASEEAIPELDDLPEGTELPDVDDETEPTGKGLLDAAEAMRPDAGEDFLDEEPEEPVPPELPDDVVYKGTHAPEAKEPVPQKDEKTTMNLVSDALQSAVNAPVKKEFRDAADMFKTLRNLSSSLPPVQKDAFFNSLNKLKLDYVIQRLSGKPGLLSAASAIRQTGGIAGMKTENKPSLLKTMTYMRTLINSLPDASQSWLLGKEVDKVIHKAHK